MSIRVQWPVHLREVLGLHRLPRPRDTAVAVKRARDAAEREDRMLLVIQPLIAGFVHVENKRVRLEDQELARGTDLPFCLLSIQFRPVS